MIKKPRTPWLFIPSTYFAEGMPYILVNTVSVVMYHNMGISNALIGLTSFFYLPWVIKMFWGPVVDIYQTKRFWIISMQAILAVLFLAAAASVPTGLFFPATLILFTLAAFISATHDIAIDGFYMLALNEEKQAFFIGIRSLFYRVAWWYGIGFLVMMTGWITDAGFSNATSWISAYGLSGVIFVGLTLFHFWYLPFPDSDTLSEKKPLREIAGPFLGAFRTYFEQPKIIPILAFILLYRFGEGLLVKMTAPFLLDSPEKGGLGLTNTEVGIAQGTIGLAALIAGGILGGWLISKFGLKKCIWPMAFALNLPDLFYLMLAYTKPSMLLIYSAIAIEQLGYGLGFTSFTVFLMYIAKGKYKTSHFAISTGFMALGMMVPGLISGYLQETLGYFAFFLTVIFLTIPGMISILFIPLDNDNTQT